MKTVAEVMEWLSTCPREGLVTAREYEEEKFSGRVTKVELQIWEDIEVKDKLLGTLDLGRTL